MTWFDYMTQKRFMKNYLHILRKISFSLLALMILNFQDYMYIFRSPTWALVICLTLFSINLWDSEMQANRKRGWGIQLCRDSGTHVLFYLFSLLQYFELSDRSVSLLEMQLFGPTPHYWNRICILTRCPSYMYAHQNLKGTGYISQCPFHLRP